MAEKKKLLKGKVFFRVVQVSMTDDDVSRIDELAKSSRMGRSAFLRWLLYSVESATPFELKMKKGVIING